MKTKHLLAGLTTLLLGTLMIGINIIDNNKSSSYLKADAAISVDGLTKITTDNLNLLSPGSKIYLVSNLKTRGLGGTNSALGFGETDTANMEYFEVTDIDDNDIAFKSLFDSNTYKNKYINIADTTTALKLTSSTLTYLTLDSDGKLSCIANATTYYLAWNGDVAGLYITALASQYFNIYLDPSASISVDEYSYDFLHEFTCDETGVSAPTSKSWNNMKSIYNKLSSANQLTLRTMDGDELGTDIEQAIAKYDYVISKYNTTSSEVYEDYIGRVEANKIVLSSKGDINITNNKNSNNSNTIVIIAITSISFVAFLSYMLLRKKR